MDLTFSTEQQELAEAVRRFSREQITPERLNAWEKMPGGIDPECWATIAALGWIGLGLPQSAGGSGLGLVDVACLMSECTRGLVPTVVGSAVRGGCALAVLDPTAPELTDLAAGKQRATLVLHERNASSPAAIATRLDGGASPRLTGEKWYATHAAVSDLLIVATREGEAISLVLVERAAAEVGLLRGFVSDETQAVIRFRDTPILRRLGPPGAAAGALEQLQHQQTALALAEMVGGMAAVLERTVAYVKEREQFGQKIAVFQAVQHQIADMATTYTAARHLAWQAITRIAEDRQDGLDLATAAAFVGQGFKRLTLTAHHLHGGAGYVVEHPLHYYSERAQSLCIRYTPEADALEAIAADLLDG